ncbi:MAG: hypothetical protein JNM25_02530 [Planctomycetes bacterium]|nr:hypothetical protein [Planctomycetota bacterium]
MNELNHLLLAALTWPALAAQRVPEGLDSRQTPLPAAAASPLALPAGDLVYFDGTDLWHATPGQPPLSLLHLPTVVFGSFTLDVGAGNLLFAENTTNRLWLVPLQGPPPAQPLANIVYNYDAARLGPQHVLVSAKTGGFGTPDNDLVVLDLQTGAVQQLASLPGASGPVAVADNGDVYYATASLAFPTPPGQTSVLRFRRPVVDAARQQGTVLGLADADLVFAGLDAAADICLDDDGDLLFTDWFQNTLGELNDVDGPAPWRSAPLLSYGAAAGAAAVQFLASGSAPVFEPFQPVGGTLVVFETDFVATSTLRFVTPRRAQLTPVGPAPIPSGNVTLQVVDGPANGLGLLAIALDATPGNGTFAVAGFEQPLHWRLVLANTPLLQPAPFAADGTLSVTFWNPGFVVPVPATAQVALLSSSGILGSSSAQVLVFGP